MSLKAGRVGVNPADVDPINGHLSPSAVDGYTKAQADAKFQPKTLAVPIKYLNGSVLGTFSTVQEALSGSYGENGAMTNEELTAMISYKAGDTITLFTDMLGMAAANSAGTTIYGYIPLNKPVSASNATLAATTIVIRNGSALVESGVSVVANSERIREGGISFQLISTNSIGNANSVLLLAIAGTITFS